MDAISVTPENLPREHPGQRTSAWWGMLCLIATEAILFVYLIFAYAYVGSQQPGPWPPTGPPALSLAGLDTLVLVASSFVLGYGQRVFVRRGSTRALQWALGITFVMGVVFVAVQGIEWRDKPFDFGDNAYSAAYFTMTGTHMVHVVIGLCVMLTLLVWSLSGRLTDKTQHLRLGELYWHFVDVVWLAVFTTVYLIPRIS